MPFVRLDEGLGAGSVLVGRLDLRLAAAIAVIWNFRVAGGTAGVAEATAVQAAVGRAVAERLPLVSVLATAGTRLTEGMRALVGIPRLALAMDRLRAARLPHLCVADAPTTGGVWVALGCAADLRVGVAGATVAFSGPRVVEAMTGRPLAPGAGTAEAAYRAGLLDAVVAEEAVPGWLERALAALGHLAAGHIAAAEPPETATQGAEGRVVAAGAARPDSDGAALVDRILAGAVDLACPDATVRAGVGRLGGPGGPAAVAVALAAAREGLVGSAGFATLARAARLADTLDAPLITLIDTLGGDPHEETVPAAILDATRAVLACRSPTVALVHGAGGSGGALAAAVCDRVLVGPRGWFGALAPAGAAAALRRPLEEALTLLRPFPEALLADGFADAAYDAGGEPGAAVRAVTELRREPAARRLARRRRRWSRPLPENG